ncbi:hypothetical protein ABT299_30220 [Spirillospora sp. NPDC000708]
MTVDDIVLIAFIVLAGVIVVTEVVRWKSNREERALRLKLAVTLARWAGEAAAARRRSQR